MKRWLLALPAAGATPVRVHRGLPGGQPDPVDAGGAPVNGWQLTFTFPGDQRITNAWSATVSQNGSNVSAVNASYDATISPGGNVSFGFQGTWASNDTSPSSFTLNGTACT